MTPASRLRYLAWRAIAADSPIQVKLRTGERLIIRPARGKDSYDLSVAHEIFVGNCYLPPPEFRIGRVSRVLDVGANVGYASLFFARIFPAATIEAFEPYPVHIDLIRAHLALNRLEERVKVHPFAVGVLSASGFMSDAGPCSSVSGDDGAIPVRIEDLFDSVGDRQIDFLKLDCEGAEYDIVMDERFAHLPVGTLVMEWHDNERRSGTRDVLHRRLLELGWHVQLGQEVSFDPPVSGLVRAGLMWCRRNNQ
jgi:FkbM family methyltransferase